MKFPIKISPSLLSADFGALREAALQAEKGGGSALHLDIMDGHYVHNFSFGIDIIPALKSHVKIPLVAHLEIDNPDVFIEDFARAGSDMIVVQEDTCPHLPITIAGIKKHGARAGIGINPDRGFEKIEANPEILKQIDLLIIMAVYPGFGGQPFSPVTVPKIQKACEMRTKSGARFDIGVDGSVNEDTIPKIVGAGANYLIAGSSVFSRGPVGENIRNLRVLAEKSLGT
jgi:ribulose-phosphate 3-epimerase